MKALLVLLFVACATPPVATTSSAVEGGDLVVDGTTKLGGMVDMCLDAVAGCGGKPNFQFDPTTGHTQVIGTGADWSTIRALFDVKATLDEAEQPQQLVQLILDGTSRATEGSNFNLEATNHVVNTTGARNIALLVSAKNSTAGNLAIESQNGDWYQSDPQAKFTNNGRTLLYELSAPPGSRTYDFSQASCVRLGTNVASPVVVPGGTSLNPLIGLGVSNGSGEQLVTKNTVTGAFGARAGVAIGIDTAVDPGARGGIAITRGPGGGFGSDGKGLHVSYGNDLTTYQSAGDLVVYNRESSKSIFFVTGGVGAVKTPLGLDGTTGHWLADGPRTTASCGAVSGPDAAFVLTASSTGTCSIGFASPGFAAKPSCSLFVEGGLAAPSCTVGAQGIECTAGIVAGGFYHWHCIGTSSQAR